MPKDNKTDSYTQDEVLSPNFFCTDFYQKRKKGKYRLNFAPSTQYLVADTHCHIEMFDYPEIIFLRCALHNVGFVACVVDSTDDGIEGMIKVEKAYEKAKQMLPDVIDRIKNEGKQLSEPIIIKAAEQKPEFCLNLDAICKNPVMPKLRFIVGTHPHYAKYWDSVQEKNLIEMLKHPLASCVGEIGLDFHYDLSPRSDQIEVFKHQLKIADNLGFPVSLHLREAHSEAIKVFNEVGFSEHGTLLHCFNLAIDDLRPWVDAGCYIALGGPITFKKAEYTRDAVKIIPKDKLLTETDAPFMTPEPLRGDVCFPDHVIYNAEMLYDILGKNENKEKFYAQMYKNALDLLDR